MKRKRYSEEKIVRILREVESGQSMAETSRKYGVHEQTIYRWRAKYEGMEVSDVRRMKELEEENRRLKKIVAQQTLDNYALKDLLSKKW
ncbi:MAG: transposase [Deltaproteobacteria bacterium]|nr:transposase [Deltaproteobacteria bacterium]